MDLAVDEGRVDGGPAVVHCHIAHEVDLASLDVDVHDASVCAERPDEVLRVVEHLLREARLHPGGKILRNVRGTCDVGERHRLVR